MGYPKEVYDDAWRELERRATTAREEQRARREEIRRILPEIEQLERAMAKTAANITGAVMLGKKGAVSRIEELKQLSLSLQQQRAALLQKQGYPTDYLAEQHGCNHCRDTGYTGRKMCHCLKELLTKAAYLRLGAVSNANDCSFESFSLSYYPEQPLDHSGIVPRRRMAQIFQYCRQYATDFSHESESLLFLGQTGLGKTHLSLAIASAVTGKGFGVLYSSVQKLMDRLESQKFSNANNMREQYRDSVNYILHCDLLVLDDLGTEFYTQFTASVLYNIINSRLAEKRPTIINTNLDLPKIEEKYSQRMVSRLACGYKVLRFCGKDIRFIQKTGT